MCELVQLMPNSDMIILCQPSEYEDPVYLQNQHLKSKVGWLVGSLDFYGISTFVGYLTPNPFLRK